MAELPVCTIPSGAMVWADELEQVLELLVRSRLYPGESRLLGQGALQLKAEGRRLKVIRLTARSNSGLRFDIKDAWLTLPAHGLEPLVRVGMEWVQVPVADGSAIRCGRPCLRLLAPGEAGADGEFVLARDAENGPVPVPVCGDSLNSCDATASWAEAVESMLIKLDQHMAGLIARLARSGAPVLTWGWLLQPVWVSLADARGSTAAIAPDTLIACCLKLFSTVTELSSRASMLGDAFLAALFSRLPLPSLYIGNASFHERCETVSASLQAADSWLEQLLRVVGTGLQSLPDVLYHAGKLYLRREAVAIRTEEELGGTVIRNLDGPDGRVNLAVLWDTTERVLLGDVRFASAVPARGASKHQENLYLGGLASGSDFHWLPDVPVTGARLESPRRLKWLDAATYIPAIP